MKFVPTFDPKINFCYANVYYNAAIRLHDEEILKRPLFTSCQAITAGFGELVQMGHVEKARLAFAKLFKPHGAGEYWFEVGAKPIAQAIQDEREHRTLALLLMYEMSK